MMRSRDIEQYETHVLSTIVYKLKNFKRLQRFTYTYIPFFLLSFYSTFAIVLPCIFTSDRQKISHTCETCLIYY